MGDDMRLKRALGALGIIGALALAGCSDQEAERQREELEAAQARIEQALAEAEELEVAVGELTDQVERFDTEDWKAVVGDVRTSVDNVELEAVEVRGVLE